MVMLAGYTSINMHSYYCRYAIIVLQLTVRYIDLGYITEEITSDIFNYLNA